MRVGIGACVAGKRFYTPEDNPIIQAGVAEWLTRRPREFGKEGQDRKGKIAGGLRARRGSNPFPGASRLLSVAA